jgi:glycosyltransferase involved in cell wall biosynthesis
MRGRFDVTVIGRLARIIRDRRIEIVHTHGYKSDIIGLLAARRGGVRTLSTPHGFGESMDLKLRSYVAVGSYALRFFDCVAPLSEQLRDQVRGFGAKNERIRLIRNAVDLSEVEPFRDRRSGLRNPDSRRIGYVGQLIPRKNVVDLIQAFELVAARVDDVELVVVGDGPERPSLEARVAASDLGARVRFLGYRADRLEHMANFDVFALASRYEGIPRVLMEAQAMGVPVVAYDIPGVDQLVTSGETGLLAPVDDVHGLADALLEVLREPGLGACLAENARNAVVESCSPDRMAGEYLDLYRELAA